VCVCVCVCSEKRDEAEESNVWRRIQPADMDKSNW
jgi:hypothetical protein